MTTTLIDPSAPPVFEGVYDVPEVARYLKAAINGERAYPVSSAKLIRWIRRGVASPDLADISGQDLLIAFEDVVSMRVIAALRAVGVKWSEIDRTEQWLRKETGAKRPFATESLWAGQGQLFVDWKQRLLSGSRHGQLALGLLQEYLIPVHGLMFSETTHMATSWEPLDQVLLKPTVQFGAPCIKGTRIPTRTIAGMIDACYPVEWVAGAYELSLTEVKAARDWESALRAA